MATRTKKAKSGRLIGSPYQNPYNQPIEGGRETIDKALNKRPRFSIFSNATGAKRSKRAE